MAWMVYYKTKFMGVKCDLQTLVKCVLFERQQKVVLNWQETKWLTIRTNAPQGSILGILYIDRYIDR